MYVVVFLLVGLRQTLNSSLLVFLISKMSRKGRVLLDSSSYRNFIEDSTLFSLSVMLCK